MIQVNCSACGAIRQFSSPADLKRRNVYQLCRECYLKMLRETGNPGKKRFYINNSGYKMVVNRKHPYANGIGYVREHRLVMEKKLGRYLAPNEYVHHLDKNKLNNSPENLILVGNDSSHFSHHKKNRKCTLCDKKHVGLGYCRHHYYLAVERFKPKNRSSKGLI